MQLRSGADCAVAMIGGKLASPSSIASVRLIRFSTIREMALLVSCPLAASETPRNEIIDTKRASIGLQV